MIRASNNQKTLHSCGSNNDMIEMSDSKDVPQIRRVIGE